MQEETTTIVDAVKAIPPAVWGFIMAFVVAVLRVIYDREETTRMRIFLEAVICGCLTLAASEIIHWLNLPEGLAVAAGGVIGFIGVTKLRDIVVSYLDRQSRKDNK